MTKILKTISALFLCAIFVFALASCSAQKKYEKYAEDIRVAAAKEEPLSYVDVVSKLGEPTIDLSTDIFGSGKTGWITWYDGCEDLDAYEAKLEEGKKVAYIRVSFNGGEAVDAEAGVKTPEEEK